MIPSPSELMKLRTVDSEWKKWTQSPGIYLILRESPVNRIFGTDNSGLLYIGKAKVLRDRVHQFIRSDHNTSWFLYSHRDLAKKYLSSEIPDDEKKLLPFFGELNVRYIECESELQAEEIERISIFSYVNIFGETPPLNSSIPDKYSDGPSLEEINWFKELLEYA